MGLSESVVGKASASLSAPFCFEREGTPTDKHLLRLVKRLRTSDDCLQVVFLKRLRSVRLKRQRFEAQNDALLSEDERLKKVEEETRVRRLERADAWAWARTMSDAKSIAKNHLWPYWLRARMARDSDSDSEGREEEEEVEEEEMELESHDGALDCDDLPTLPGWRWIEHCELQTDEDGKVVRRVPKKKRKKVKGMMRSKSTDDVVRRGRRRCRHGDKVQLIPDDAVPEEFARRDPDVDSEVRVVAGSDDSCDEESDDEQDLLDIAEVVTLRAKSDLQATQDDSDSDSDSEDEDEDDFPDLPSLPPPAASHVPVAIWTRAPRRKRIMRIMPTTTRRTKPTTTTTTTISRAPSASASVVATSRSRRRLPFESEVIDRRLFAKNVGCQVKFYLVPLGTELARRIETPLLSAFGLSGTYGLMHTGVQVGPWALEWNNSGLVVPRSVLGKTSSIVMLDLASVDVSVKVDVIVGRVANLIAKWNTRMVYHQNPSVIYRRDCGNCQDFVVDLMRCLGLSLRFKGPIRSFMSQVATNGSAARTLRPTRKMRMEFGLKRRYVFTSHQQLDVFAKMLADESETVRTDYPDAFRLLKAFDRGFWLRNHRYMTVQEWRPSSLGCPFGDPFDTGSYLLGGAED